ncbi:hypothetical protein ACFYO1_29560 [Nocardia sp. NPDC006044]|uniref:hypothetical protein n=1 Tax=Nocardia sp. NPDC006044 TaxID=3364306 RepID=UPI00367A1590
MTRPTELPDERRAHLPELLATCPQMTALARLAHESAQLMSNRRGSELDYWINQVRQAQLPELNLS